MFIKTHIQIIMNMMIYIQIHLGADQYRINDITKRANDSFKAQTSNTNKQMCVLLIYGTIQFSQRVHNNNIYSTGY